MQRRVSWMTVGLILLVAASFGARLLRSRRPPSLRTPAPVMQGEPQLMLWAWETPEDLRALDPTRAGIAYLSRELLLGAEPQVRLRRQALLLPPHVYRMAVVRIETAPEFKEDDAKVPGLTAEILKATDEPGVRALEIDFDARASERPFYTALLRAVRKDLRSDVPLSITALTSWCGENSWLHGLPVQEAVPMFFRMGGPAATRAGAARSFEGIRESLCTGSVGLATDEAWPSLDARQRMYVFHPGSWRAEDIALVNAGEYSKLQDAPLRSSQAPQD
ncbi:MAG TPA: DUF3142 domain-containing protein [Acidobacteriaceae bacterium]|jgi:hypothetical protein